MKGVGGVIISGEVDCERVEHAEVPNRLCYLWRSGNNQRPRGISSSF